MYVFDLILLLKTLLLFNTYFNYVLLSKKPNSFLQPEEEEKEDEIEESLQAFEMSTPTVWLELILFLIVL